MPKYVRYSIVIVILCIIAIGFLIWSAVKPLSKATFYYVIGQYSKALAESDKAVEQNPRDKVAYLLRGQICESLNEYPKAIDALTTAIVLDPKHPRYELRGDAYVKAGQYSHAIDDYTKAITVDSQFAGFTYVSRADAYNKIGQPEKAIDDYTKAIDMDPKNNQECYLKRGQAYFKLEEYKKAINDYDKLITDHPDKNRPLPYEDRSPIAYESRGYAYEQIGQHDKAANDFRNAIDIYTYNLQQFKKIGRKDLVEKEIAKIGILRKKLERK